MKTVAILLSVAFEVASSVALAQGGIAIRRRPAPASGNWIVSETTSPVDYKPIVTASTYVSRQREWLRNATLHSMP